MDDLIRKYSEELQKTQRDRNELKHQLAEKDVVIEVLQRDISNLQRTMEEEAEDFKQQIRHQICEEIRKKAQKENRYILDHAKLETIDGILYTISNYVLDQIEQGESDAKN